MRVPFVIIVLPSVFVFVIVPALSCFLCSPAVLFILKNSMAVIDLGLPGEINKFLAVEVCKIGSFKILLPPEVIDNEKCFPCSVLCIDGDVNDLANGACKRLGVVFLVALLSAALK